MKVRQDAWSEENDLLLAETVLRHVREGSTQLNAFEEVGDKLNRTSAACGFRWNAVVRHQYEKALQLAKKQRKQRQRMLGKDPGGKKKLLYTPPVPTVDDFETLSVSTSMEIGSMDLHSLEMHDTSSEEVLFTETPSPVDEQDQEQLLPSLASPVQPKSSINLDMVIAYLQSFRQSTIQLDILKTENERLKKEMITVKKHNKELESQVHKLENNSETIQEDYETLMKIMNRARKLVVLEEDEERPTTKFKMDRNGNLEKVAE